MKTKNHQPDTGELTPRLLNSQDTIVGTSASNPNAKEHTKLMINPSLIKSSSDKLVCYELRVKLNGGINSVLDGLEVPSSGKSCSMKF